MDAKRTYYAQPGAITRFEDDPDTDDAMAGLPTDAVGLCRTVQGLIVHEFWTSLYDMETPAARLYETEIRPASAIVTRILELNPSPLVEPRAPEQRLIGNCRTFTTLTCALLRRAGTSARARCGFATYFEADRYIDHWILEHYDASHARWVRTDPQLDDAQGHALALTFDPADVPPGLFLPGGDAWRLCRSGASDPNQFGIMQFWGTWFVRNNVVRDLAALNKVELLPWDGWGLMDHSDIADHATDALTDKVAAATSADAWEDIRHLYETNDLLHVPANVISYRTGTPAATPT